MSVTKDDLTRLLFDEGRFSHRECKQLVEGFFEEITSALATGEEVKLSNFGVFALLNKKARPGRNPKSGIEVEISARRVVAFHPSPKLSDVAAKCVRPPLTPEAPSK